MTAKEYRDAISGKLQEIKEKGIPFVVFIDGWDSAGKGYTINELIKSIDPRFYSVVSDKTYAEFERFPFLYRYYVQLPIDGTFKIFDGSYMTTTISDCFKGNLSVDDYHARIKSINDFERTLQGNGYVVLKLFLNISEKEQLKRMNKSLSTGYKSWKITKEDRSQNANYKNWKKSFESFMADTSVNSEWHVLDATDKKDVKLEALKLLYETIEIALAKGKIVGEPYEEEFEMASFTPLADIDLSPALTEEEYEEKLKKLEKKIHKLHAKIYKKKIPVVLAFEGWDAAGKGGAIKRVAYPLDPRGFCVIPVASPQAYEKKRHFLWRFYTKLPKTGHVHIFDRTWYGRVMVERLEGFCAENDWKRAYNEINEFERDLKDWGAIVLKFWLQIDKDTQLERFTERQNTPEKQWKITEEDWRNREKWDDYEAAINEMISKTSTKDAPWHVIEAKDKLYARIKVMEIVADAMEKAVED